MRAHETNSRMDLLEKAFRSTGNGPVAYVDETYLPPSANKGGTPFYSVVSVIIEDRSDLEIIRRDLTGIAGNFWHSTENCRSNEGLATFGELVEYIAEGNEAHVIAHRARVDEDDRSAEIARREALHRLFEDLHGESVDHPPVSLVLLEQRKDAKDRKADQWTVNSSPHADAIGRGKMRAHFTSPTCDRALWIPDVVAYAHYQDATGRDSSSFDRIRDMVRFLDV